MSDPYPAPGDVATDDAGPDQPEAGPLALLASPPPEPPSGPPSAPQPDRATADGFADDIPPDSLRIDARVARELFGALFSGITTHGSAAFGNYNTINNNFASSPKPRPIVRELTHITELHEVYARSDSDPVLDKLLATRPVVCLTGPKNSGRFSTACAALARRHAASPVFEITLPSGVVPEAIVAEAGDIVKERGYVLRLAGHGHVDAIRRLAGLFSRRSANLVLIKDEGPREREQHSAEVRHRQPDPVDVFRHHLVHLLVRNHGATPDEAAAIVDAQLADIELATELGRVYAPRESVAMAEAFGMQHPVDDETRRAILAESQPRRRQRAAKILLPPAQEARPRRHRAGQHERAFRLAYAVFRQQPLHYVFEAAAWLLAEIDGAALRPDWGHLALEHPVQDLLGEELKADWLAGRDDGNNALGAARVAWIRDEGLRGAILDVAWHDFDSTRDSLLRWLDRMVRTGDTTMARAAAETAALLIHHDFDRVHHELVDAWAAAPSPRVRQAAAWTEAIADLAGDIRHLVRDKLRRWCNGTNNYRRDTAARLYASGLQQPHLAWSIADLRRIADDKMQLSSPAVAEGVNQLYRPELAGWLLGELSAWKSEANVRVHAARALLLLAARPARGVADGRSELLVRLGAGEIEPAAFAELWLIALVEPTLTLAAWPALARWLRQADEESSLQNHAAGLLRIMTARPAVRRRAHFFLNRTPEFSGDMPEWIRQEITPR